MIERALAFSGEDAVIFEHLGDIYLKLGEVDKALANYNKSLELDPANKEVTKKLIELKKERSLKR